MADVFDVLKHDHDEVKQMLAELERGSGPAASAGKDSLEPRKKMVQQLIIEESKHEAVEEEYFWPVVRELVPEGDRLADQAIEQEQSAKYILDDLLGYEPGEAKYEELLAGFIPEGRQHIDFEERQVWPELRKVISADQARELGEKVEQGKKIAPTRPHPHIPPIPGILKAAGPGVAAADRVRDKMTGRDPD